MGKQLDKIVEAYIQQSEDLLEIDESNPYTREIEEALRERIGKLITEEIVSENEQKIIEEADKIIAMEREKAHIRELKVLLWEGFIIAFIDVPCIRCRGSCW